MPAKRYSLGQNGLGWHTGRAATSDTRTAKARDWDDSSWAGRRALLASRSTLVHDSKRKVTLRPPCPRVTNRQIVLMAADSVRKIPKGRQSFTANSRSCNADPAEPVPASAQLQLSGQGSEAPPYIAAVLWPDYRLRCSRALRFHLHWRTSFSEAPKRLGTGLCAHWRLAAGQRKWLALGFAAAVLPAFEDYQWAGVGFVLLA